MRTCILWGVLLAFVNPRAQGARLSSTEVFKEDTDTKQILFLRHAESMGNLGGKRPVYYLASGFKDGQRPRYAWRDGRLSPGGETMAVSKIQGMNETLAEQLIASELVLMSPLARNMATALIALATACKRLGVDPSVLNDKAYVVTDDLREKVASDSDQPGTNPENSRDYINRLAKKYSQTFFNTSVALDSVAQKVITSYEAEQQRTENWGRGWKNDKNNYPADSEKFLKQISRFRHWLSGQSARRVFIVGHNGWSRWAFAAGLMPPCLDNDIEGPLARLAFGGRLLRPLPNLGLMSVAFSQGVFSSFTQLPHDQASSMQNCFKKTKFGLFSSVDEAKFAALLPRDAIIQRMMLNNENSKDQTVTFSASGNKSYLAWGDDFAEPLGFLELSDEVAYACDHLARKVHLAGVGEQDQWWKAVSTERRQLYPIRGFGSDIEPSTVKPFRLQARTTAESLRLCNLLNIYTRFAQDTNFISRVLSEEGWDQQTIYASQGVNDTRLRDAVKRSQWDNDYEKLHSTIQLGHWDAGYESSEHRFPAPLRLLHKATEESTWTIWR